MTEEKTSKIDKSKFRSPIGSRYTKGLFYETTKEDKSTVVYTLKEKEHKGYPSLKELYLKEEDLTEYSFASKYLDSYDHWLLLVSTSWFKPIVESWRKELKLKLESKLLKDLKELSLEESKEGLTAKRILLDYLKKSFKEENLKNPLGRPRKPKDTKEPEEPLHYTKLLDKLKNGGSPSNNIARNEPETALTEDLEAGELPTYPQPSENASTSF